MYWEAQKKQKMIGNNSTYVLETQTKQKSDREQFYLCTGTPPKKNKMIGNNSTYVLGTQQKQQK